MAGSIIFCGTPEFCGPILTALHQHFPTQIAAVLTRPDAAKGRGRKTSRSYIKELALSLTLPTYTPECKDDLYPIFASINPSVIVVAAYGLIFPKKVTEEFYCLNVHGSLLPKYRGASPIQASLLNGDRKTGITLIHMNEKMDEGPMLSKRIITVNDSDNFKSLHDQLSNISAEAVVELLSKPEWKTLPVTPQNHEDASYCGKIQRSDMEIHPSDLATVKLNKVRAFSPVPGAFMLYKNKRVKIIKAQIKEQEFFPLIVKPEGKGEMAYNDYLLGHPEGLPLNE